MPRSHELFKRQILKRRAREGLLSATLTLHFIGAGSKEQEIR